MTPSLSTDRFLAVRRLAVLALGFSVLAPPAVAAQVDFRPVLTFGVLHSGNVRIIGTDTVAEESAAIAVDLSVDRATASSDFSFLYQATYIGYRRNSGLDFLGNLLAASYGKQVSRRTNLQATGGVLRTDVQGVAASSIDSQSGAASNVDRPLTFVPRTTITRGYGDVSGSVGVGRRGFVDWAVRAGVSRYAEVPGVVLNNSTSAGARGGWRYELNERGTLGLAVSLDWFAYDVGANVVTEGLVLTGTYNLGRYTGLTYDAGLTRSTSDGLSTTSATILLSFERVLSKVSSLTAGVRQFVTPGTGLQGATSDSGTWISYKQSSPRNGLDGRLVGAYWYSKGLQFGDTPTTNTQTLNLAGALGWRFNRFLSLSAAYAYFYQLDRGDSASSLNTRYASYGLFLRWGIRGLADSPRGGARRRR